MITLPQIKGIAQAAAQSAVRGINAPETVTTTDATPYVTNIPVTSGTVGLVKVTVVATDIDGQKITGEKWVSYEWLNTILTMGAVVTIFSQNTIAGDFTIAAGVENIEVTLTGIAATEIRWSVKHTVDIVVNDITSNV